MKPLGNDAAIRFRLSDSLQELQELEEGLMTIVLEAVPAERLLRGLSPEVRVRGLPPEERLAGLSEEDVARVRELIERLVPEFPDA